MSRAMPSDEYSVVDQLLSQKPPLPIVERIRRLAPHVFFQIFALAKFSLTLTVLLDRPWSRNEFYAISAFLAMDTLLLLSAVLRDWCSLLVASVLSFLLLVVNVILLIVVPVFITSFFASGAADHYVGAPRGWKMFDDVRDAFKSKEELHFFKGFEYGMSVEVLLLVLVLVHALQMTLVSGVWNAKLDAKNQKQQESAMRNSVYLV